MTNASVSYGRCAGQIELRRRWPLQALLLDLDDTILNDKAGLLQARDYAAEILIKEKPCLELPVVRAEILRVATWWWEDPERHRRGRLDLVDARGKIFAKVLEHLGCPDFQLARAVGRAYTERRESYQRFLPGAAVALKRLHARVPAMALVTNGAASAQRAKVERFALGRYFDHIQIEGEFGVGKPEPVVFATVLERLGIAPEVCLMVGDNFEADVLGAQAVDIDAVWINAKARKDKTALAARPYWIARSLAELEAMIPWCS